MRKLGIGLLTIFVALSLVQQASALIIPAGDTLRFDFNFGPVKGPFTAGAWGIDGFTVPNTEVNYSIQVFDTANNLLGERSLISTTSAKGEASIGTGLELLAPTSVTKGYLLFGPIGPEYDLTFFFFMLDQPHGPAATEPLYLGGGLIPTLIAPRVAVSEGSTLPLFFTGIGLLCGLTLSRKVLTGRG